MPRDGGTIGMADVRAWVEARWAAERADPVRMADEAERRALAAEVGDDEYGVDDEATAADPAAPRTGARTAEVQCPTCGGVATTELPDPLGGSELAALPALVHGPAMCVAWRTAVLRWPDGHTLVVEIPAD